MEDLRDFLRQEGKGSKGTKSGPPMAAATTLSDHVKRLKSICAFIDKYEKQRRKVKKEKRRKIHNNPSVQTKCKQSRRMQAGGESPTDCFSSASDECENPRPHVHSSEQNDAPDRHELLHRLHEISERLNASKRRLCENLPDSIPCKDDIPCVLVRPKSPCVCPEEKWPQLPVPSQTCTVETQTDFPPPPLPPPPEEIIVEIPPAPLPPPPPPPPVPQIPPTAPCPFPPRRKKPCKDPCPSAMGDFLCQSLLHSTCESYFHTIPDKTCRQRSPTPIDISESGTMVSVRDDLYQEVPECDVNDSVTVYVDKTRFVASRNILINNSRYFRDILSGSGLATQPPRVVVGGVQSSFFRLIYEWMKDSIPPARCHLSEVLLSAVKLDIPALVEQCLQVLQKEMDAIDLMDIYENALVSGSQSLREAIHLLTTASFLQIVRSGRFLAYSSQRVVLLLKDDSVAILREWEVFEAALRWLRFDWEERHHLAEEILSCVRFGLMTEEQIFIAAFDPRARFVMELPEAQAAINKALLYHLLKHRNLTAFYPQFVPPPRTYLKHQDCSDCSTYDSFECKPICNPFDEKKAPRRIFRVEEDAALTIQAGFRGYDARKRLKLWNQYATIIQKCYKGYRVRRHLQELQCATTLIGAVYRGYRIRRAIAVLKELGKKLRSSFACGMIVSRPMPAMSLGLREPTVLLLGGLDPRQSWNGDNVGREMLRYDPCADEWEDVGYLPEPMHHAAAAVLDGLIYITGGCVPAKSHCGQEMLATNRVWCLHPSSCEWARLPMLRHCRIYHNLVAVCGKLYALGGENRKHQVLSSVEWIEPSDKCKWHRGLPMMRARMGSAAAEFHGRLWVCGGLGRSSGRQRKLTLLSSVECYDYTQNCWMLLQPLPQPRCFSSLVCYNNTLHLVGGATAAPSGENDSPTIGDAGSVLMMDPDLQQWCERMTLCIPRHGAVAVQLGRRLLVIAGISTKDQRSLEHVEQWVGSTRLPCPSKLPHPLTGACSVILPPKEFLCS